MPLPTNIAGSYPDRGPGDTAHQEHHDAIHAAVNEVTEGRLSESGLSAAIAAQVNAILQNDYGLTPTPPDTTVTAPTGFALSTLPMPTVTRSGETGDLTATVDYSTLMPAQTGTTWYTASNAGTDTDGLTAGTPLRLNLINNQVMDGDTIIYAPGEYTREATSTVQLNKSLRHIASGPGVRITGWNHPADRSWTLHAGAIYKTARSNVTAIYDVVTTETWGDFTRYTQRDTLAEVVGPGEWYTDNVDVHVWCLGSTDLSAGGTNREQIRLQMGTLFSGIYVNGTYAQYVEGIDFEGTKYGLTAANGATIIAKDCTSRYTPSGQAGCFATANGHMILENCEASGSMQDGFNYHDTALTGGEFIEIGCTSHHNGLDSTTLIHNASTAHDDVLGIRVGCTYDESNGPVVADVGDSVTWNLGCSSGNSIAADGQGVSWFTDAQAVMWNDTCSASDAPYAYNAKGTSTINRYSDTVTNVGEAYPGMTGTLADYTPADVA